MVIKNKTVFNSEEVKKSIINENRLTLLRKMIIVVVIFIMGILITVLSLSKDDSIYFVLGLGCMLYSVLTVITNSIKLNKMNKRVDEDFKYEITNGVIYEYSFHEEKLKLNIKVGDRSNKSEIFYTNLKKIVNYKDVIVFVVAAGNSYKCKKIGFTDKRQEELFFFGLKKHDIKIVDKSEQNEKAA